jgi:hypothetical protein
MSLTAAIQQIDDWQTKTAAQLLAELQAETIPYIDTDLWTWAGVALVAGPEGAEGLRLALESNNMGWAVHQFGGSGLLLSSDQVQPVLYAFAQAGVPNMDVLARHVKRNVSVIESQSLGNVTIDLVSAALAQLTLEATKSDMRSAAAIRYNDYIASVDAWDGAGSGPVL